jgi:hypothetical protein
MNVEFYDRVYANVFPKKELHYQVDSLDWSVYGGCSKAEISVTGPEEDLWSLLDYLRYGATVLNKFGKPIWWGYVHAVTVPVGEITIGASLEKLYNDVSVAYSLIQTDKQTIGYRKTTAWSSTARSITEYGRKQFLSSQSSLSDDMATARRDAILERFGYPGQTFDFGSAGNKTAKIQCKGWWDTLRWQYANVAAVPGLSYQTTSATEQAVGSSSANSKVMMVINLSGRSLNSLGVQVYARKQGSPTDDLVLSVYQANDNTDVPEGSSLGSVNVAGGSMSGSLAWVGGLFSSEAQLRADKDYCLVVSRSGAVNASNYFVVNVNTGLGFTHGFFKIYGGSSWADRSPDADMPFIISVNNNVESTNQIRELCQTYGQFFVMSHIEAASGLMLPSYQDGDTMAIDVIEALMDSGGANGRRIISAVDVNRTASFWEEPVSNTGVYKLDRHGRLLTEALTPIEESEPPIGVYCQLYNILPGNVDISKLNSPETQFIEGASWTLSDGLRPYFRGMDNPNDFLKVQR